jgi:pyruvate,orthophosphate dikinase
MPQKYVYSFGGGGAEGSGERRALLGGKGAGLAEMSRLGLPVPPGFTITTEVCTHYQKHGGRYPAALRDEVDAALHELERKHGRSFGDAHNPLLVSVRSGAPVSMPGMMDTVLNIGLNHGVVAAQSGSPATARWARDCYRRLLQMYGDVVLGVPEAPFEQILTAARRAQGAASDAELSVASLDTVIAGFEEHIRASGKQFPHEPMEQLWGAIAAVFESWDNKRAREYRRLNGVPETLGTAVNVQAMVFGNRDEGCATGVAFTRNPSTGARELYGEFLVCAQGEDVVAGTRTPQPIRPLDGEGVGLRGAFAAAEEELAAVCEKLERHYRNMQDVEFTIEDGKLYMLQTRAGKRTGLAAARIAVDMVEEGLIESRQALERVQPAHLLQLLAPGFDPAEKERARAAGRVLAKGLAAGPGAACGRVAFTAERAAAMAAAGPVLLVRDETSPDDIVGMHAAAGILTARGGMTSHAAVVARGMGKPCIVGAEALHVDEHAGALRVAGQVLGEGDMLSIDGTTGEVIAGVLEPHPSEVLQVVVHGKEATQPELVRIFRKLLTWADAERRLRVRTNADTPHDARVAVAFGAEGIGLCRTEHMFFAEERIPWVQRMILAAGDAERAEALRHLLPMQQGDFEGIFQAMSGLPVTIRLLDPPLHEFLPHEPRAIERVAAQMGVSAGDVEAKVEQLRELNPMLGHRGCRLGLTFPEIYIMQAEAIARAAAVRQLAGDLVLAEIMVPLVGTEQEMVRLRAMIEETVARTLEAHGAPDLEVKIGTMIEVPRAALVANRIALHADFFSFGTNDLTQMTYGYSRDDAGRFLPQYVEQKVLPADPFARLDDEGVGQLVELACQRGRAARPNLKLGICGEHGGDPHSIDFFERVGLDYVSCSPYRVPIARLAAARSKLGFGAGDETV